MEKSSSKAPLVAFILGAIFAFIGSLIISFLFLNYFFESDARSDLAIYAALDQLLQDEKYKEASGLIKRLILAGQANLNSSEED
jgi:hypothetical protein